MFWAIEELSGRADLHRAAIVHHNDLVCERQRLGLIVSDIDHQQVKSAMHALQFRPQLPFQRRIDHGQRFVEQHRRYVGSHKAATERDFLLGVRSETSRAAIEVRGQIEHLGDFRDAAVDDGLREPAVLQRKCEIFGDRHRVVDHGKLEDLRNVPLLGRQMRDVLVAEEQPAFGRDDETGDNVEQSRLAATRGSEQRIGEALFPDMLKAA